MKHSGFKTVVCNFLFLLEAALLFFLLSAAIQGSIGLLAALGYAGGSFVGVNLLAALLTAQPARAAARRRSAAHPKMPLRVVPGRRHAA